MSLCCDETGRIFSFGEPLWVISRHGFDWTWAAIGAEIITTIPLELRLSEPRKPEEGGADVHTATSTKNGDMDAYNCIRGFVRGPFQFSVSQETLERYMPRHAKRGALETRLQMTIEGLED